VKESEGVLTNARGGGAIGDTKAGCCPVECAQIPDLCQGTGKVRFNDGVSTLASGSEPSSCTQLKQGG